MSSRHCSYCPQLIPPDIVGNTCPNCGGALSSTPRPTAQLPPLLQNLIEPLAPTEHVGNLSSGEQPSSLSALNPPGSVLPPWAHITIPSMVSRLQRVEGKVDAPVTKEVEAFPLEWWSHRLLRFCFNPIFAFLSYDRSITRTPDVEPTMRVAKLHIRIDPHTVVEARIEGEIITGEPSFGHHVSLQGHYHKNTNTLIVEKGYNFHLSTTPITIRRPPLRRWIPRIAAIVLTLLVLITMGLFLSLFSSHSGSHPSSGDSGSYLSRGIVFYVLAITLSQVSSAVGRFVMGLLMLGAAVLLCAALQGAPIPFPS